MSWKRPYCWNFSNSSVWGELVVIPILPATSPCKTWEVSGTLGPVLRLHPHLLSCPRWTSLAFCHRSCWLSWSAYWTTTGTFSTGNCCPRSCARNALDSIFSWLAAETAAQAPVSRPLPWVALQSQDLLLQRRYQAMLQRLLWWPISADFWVQVRFTRGLWRWV